MSNVLWGVAAYILVQFAVGVWVSLRIKSTADYVLAGRRLGTGLLAFSVFATFFGAEAIVGTAGSVYEKGLSGGQADPFGYGFAIILVGAVFAAGLWRRGLITFADFFAQRYAPWVGKLVVFVLLPGSLFWAAAQVRAFGTIVSAASGVDVQIAIGLAAVIVMAYSVLGGLLADTWTDLIQGLAVIVGLIVLLVVILVQLGGLTAAGSQIAAERLTLVAAGPFNFWSFAENLAVPICGTVVAIEIISRVLGARSGEVAARGAVAGGILYIAIGFIPLLLGLLAPALVPNLANSEQVVAVLAEKYLPNLLYVMFAGAVISAILSTVDSVLLASAAQVSNNLVTPALRSPTDSQKLLITRLTVVGLALLAFWIALSSGKVKDLIETASAAGSSGVFIVAVMGLFTRLGGALAAAATIVIGITSWSFFRWGIGLETPYLASLALAAITYATCCGIEKARG